MLPYAVDQFGGGDGSWAVISIDKKILLLPFSCPFSFGMAEKWVAGE